MILSDRDQFLGLHMTKDGKNALRNEAKKQNKSMSQLANELIVASLRQLGHTIVKEA